MHSYIPGDSNQSEDASSSASLLATVHLLPDISQVYLENTGPLALHHVQIFSGKKSLGILSELVCGGKKKVLAPDNGLISVVAARARDCACWRIVWRPPELSSSFHGRDLFAPVAAAIARDAFPDDRMEHAAVLDVTFSPADLPRVIYVDHYGNCATGLRAGAVPREARLAVAGRLLAFARVFSDVSPGETFWYENSLGLVEVAAHGASAAAQLGLKVGDPIGVG